jgi:hypothetical protein
VVIIDRFTKYGYFIALKHHFTVRDVAKLFLDHLYKLYGFQASIFIDRDMVFTILFWKELFRLLKVKLLTSFSYHP